MIFVVNLLIGLVLSQVTSIVFEKDLFKVYTKIVTGLTMWCLSFIMINVGYEFTIDKAALSDYMWDYLIAMTAAGFPWVFVGVWFALLFQDSLKFDDALLIARFAAPTSAGILFSMLEGAGLKDTWVFQKARILAIFDDLDTILLMVPLKVVMIGFKFEMLITVLVIIVLLLLNWFLLHKLKLPHAWYWTFLYAGVIAAICKSIYLGTEEVDGMEAIHMEVLLPAFVWGCLIDTPCAREELKLQRRLSFERKLRRSRSSLSEGSKSSSTLGQVSENGQEHPSTTSLPHTAPSVWQVPPQESQDPPQRDCSKDSSYNGTHAAWEAAPVTKPCKGLPDNDALAVAWQGDLEQPVKPARHPSKPRRPSKDSTTSMTSSGSQTRYGLPRPVNDESEEHESDWEHGVQTMLSMFFMLLVGMSMPPLIGKNKGDDDSAELPVGEIIFHVSVVTFLMIIGKMFPVLCYRDEATWTARLALCLGMCPRGEVGASIIVISLDLGVEGPAVTIAMLALTINLVLSGGFIAAVKFLLRCAPETPSNDQVFAMTDIDLVDVDLWGGG